MKKSNGIAMLGLLAGLGVSALADNPISTYHYLADPSCASDGETFYILTDVDDYNNQTNWNYDIIGLYAFSSEDMKNWTDHGMIFLSGELSYNNGQRTVNYPNNTWASGIAVKNGKAYIVYPDGASGVGMITAPAIDGPYTDPVLQTHKVNRIAGGGNSLIGGCDGIANCFDPGILIENDTGYVVFGGGSNGSRGNGNNFDIIRFTESKDGVITFDKNTLKRVSLPNSFEAPYLHKKGDYYYLSFNNNSQVIAYGMSKNIWGPYDYVGTVIPGIGSVPDAHGEGGNNHHGFAEFKGKWYAVYHDRRLVTSNNHPTACTRQGVCSVNPNYENHRSVAIDEITWNGNKMNTLQFTREGPKQIKNFDPYRTYKAITSSKQLNIRSRTDREKGKPVKHVLTPQASKESWIRVSGVDFGNGAQNLRVKAASVADGNKIEIHTGSASGTLAGTCNLAKTSGWQDYVDNDCEMSGLTGVIDQIFFVFKGAKDSTMGILEWEFQGTKREPEPQTPFGGKAWAIPGKIEMENFDEPGYGAGNNSYSDDDADDHGAESNDGKSYREGTGVDIYKKATGYVVGYNRTGEWLEYTVNVAATGDYTMFAAVASGSTSGAFKLSMDGEDITEEIAVPKNEGDDNYDDYGKVKANVKLTEGKHILRFTVTGDWMDIDYIQFASGKDAKDPDDQTGMKQAFRMNVNTAATFDVFDLTGKKVASFTARNMAEAKKLWLENAQVRKTQGMCMIRNRSTGMIAKVRVTR
jgi:hypothetical protein